MLKSEDVQRLERKMEEHLDNVMGRKDGLVKVASPDASMANTNYRRYRSSFLTLSDMQIPDDYRQIFRWCRYFFKFDPLIGAATRSLSVFPITDILYTDSKTWEEQTADNEEKEFSETYKFYTNMFKELDLYKHLIEVGYDYYLYGNCVIFAEPGVKTVRRRNKETRAIYEKKEVVWKSVERLDVTRLKIDRDPQTKEKVYYYDVPPDIKRIIQTKTPKEKYDKIPQIYKDAVAKKGVVKLKSKYVYHLAMPSESGDSGLWATPPVLHVMKLLLYTNILRQAQEAIAYEHIIPRRIYFFQETESFAPEFDFGRIADDFAFELKKQLNDPNYQVISPIPVQQIQHGGNGRSLLLVPEIEQLQDTILAGMGVPKEFIFGGISYSGATTSLRILENHFITYRSVLLNYLNDFLIRRLAELRGEWEVPDDDDDMITVDFSELKMQDDIQQKQLMVQLNTQGKLPDEVLYEKVFGLDARKTLTQLQNEKKRQLKENMELQLEQAKLQQELQGKLQDMGLELQVTEGDPNAQGDPSQQGGQSAQDPQGGQVGAVVQPMQAAQPAQAAGQPAQDPQQAAAQPTGQPPTNQREAMKIAQTMLSMTEPEQAQVIRKLPPQVSKVVMQYYMTMKQQREQDAEVDMRPMPEQNPPRRAGGV